jgi:hypothetical protein
MRLPLNILCRRYHSPLELNFCRPDLDLIRTYVCLPVFLAGLSLSELALINPRVPSSQSSERHVPIPLHTNLRHQPTSSSSSILLY